ncbi:Disulfide-bond oxidoreductase YghU [Streptococcus canis]|uniref:Disulfide-bond oxidoreductase YghU n=1 Tax=Streptococcus canis TaxID=1329 RepID=A0A3P5Y2A1_STRCB|nr:Disulfide-bond oxidoreductase YghU [Streptococcus canis]
MTTYHIPNQRTNLGLNTDTAGSRFEQWLPEGNKSYQLYSLDTPNGVKATIMLEELTALGILEADYGLISDCYF